MRLIKKPLFTALFGIQTLIYSFGRRLKSRRFLFLLTVQTKGYFVSAAIGGSRFERDSLSVSSGRKITVKKILTITAAKQTLAYGFSDDITGTIKKVHGQYFPIVPVLFCCLTIFFEFFPRFATNHAYAASVSAKWERNLLSPFSLARKGVRL